MTTSRRGTQALVTERARRRWDRHAPTFDRDMRFFERVLFAGGREWVCTQASGEVLEIAIGTGRNLPYYSGDVRLTGIDLSARMLDIARRRAQKLGRQVDLRVGDAQELDFPGGRFDTVVCTLSLCSIPDERAAVVEARRVLRPGGSLLLLEHVRSPSAPVRIVQRLLQPLFGIQGESLLREPLEHLQGEGFDVRRLERSKWGIVERVHARKRT